MSYINGDSGSIYPDPSLLQTQIDPTGPKVWFASQLPSGGQASVSNGAYADIERYGTLKINDSVVYSPTAPIQPNGGVKAADHVFRQMETRLDSTSLAARAVSLMDQNTGGEVLKLITFKKEISWLEKGIHKGNEVVNTISSHSVHEKERLILLNTDKSSFKLVMESLVEKRSLTDPEGDLSYFKVKTTIEGSKQALETKKSDKLSIKAAYTAEVSTKTAALQDDYSGTRAGMFDSGSYLKG